MSLRFCDCLVFALALFLIIVPLWSLEQNNDCVFIEDCEPVYWMMKNMKKIPNKTIQQVSETLKSYSDGCQFGKVHCPKEEVEEEEEELEHTTDSLYGIRNGGALENPDTLFDCQGSLKVMIIEEGTVQPFRPYSFKRNISDFKKQVKNENQVAYARVDGQCCWKIFHKKYYRGDKDVYYLSEDRPPKTSVGSFQKTDCEKLKK